MQYWNKQNFEGLEELATHLRGDGPPFDLSEYCRLRADGVRGKAFEALDRFLNQAIELPTKEKRAIINQIYELATQLPSAHQFISTPLTMRFLRPGLASWLADEPDSLPALRWDGIFNGNSTSLERALTLDPRDANVRRRLIGRECLSPVYDAVHHIDESTLLLELVQVEALLTQGDKWLNDAPDGANFDDLKHELSEQWRLIRDWKSFQESGEKSFPSWCAENDRHHDWVPKYYY